MTSNQLTYWKQEQDKIRDAETQRANMARENETRRHNLTQEELTAAQNALEERGLDIKDKDQMLKLWEMFAKYGSSDLAQLPEDAQEAMQSIFGVDPDEWPGAGSYIADVWHEIKEVFGSVGGFLKGVGSLF